MMLQGSYGKEVREKEIRLFFALELTPEWRNEAFDAQNTLKSRLMSENFRWTVANDLHLTLLFLGEQPESRLPEIVSAGESAAAVCPHFTLSPGVLGGFPNLIEPRVLWLGAQEDKNRGATLLAETLRKPLDTWIYDKKPFKPHVTLAYAKRRGPTHGISSVIHALNDANQGVDHRQAPYSISRFVLMETLPGNAHDNLLESRYNVVHSFLLGTPRESRSPNRERKHI